jgi:hypothetical protein
VEFDRMQEVRSMMMAVACAASTDDERQDMNGVGLEVFDGELHARATNGEWAMRVRRTPAYADDGFKVLVPLSYVKRHRTTADRPRSRARAFRGREDWTA